MRILAALVLALLIPSQALAASGPPPGLAGSLAIVAQDASSVTLHAEQTGGEPVTLTIKHSCYDASDSAWEVETVRFVGASDSTFSTAPFRFKGQTYDAAKCWAYLVFYFSSSRAIVLAGVDTLP